MGRVTRRSRILLTLVVAVGVLAVGTVWIVVRSQQAADALTSARSGVVLVREDLAEGRTAEAAQQLAVVQGDTARAVRATSDPVFAVASVIPVIGTTPAAVKDVAEAADALALEALPDLLEAGTALSPDALRADGNQINLAAFETASPALDSAEASLSAITADVAGIDTAGTPAQVQDAVASLQTELDDALDRDPVGGAWCCVDPAHARRRQAAALLLGAPVEQRGTRNRWVLRVVRRHQR